MSGHKRATVSLSQEDYERLYQAEKRLHSLESDLESRLSAARQEVTSQLAERLEQEVAKIAAVTVAQAMTPDPVTIGPATGLEEIAALMVEKNFHTLPVVDDGRLVGVVGKEDVLRTLLPAARR